MVSFSFSFLLVLAFLLLTLVVGLMGRKATTFREYAVDNKRLSTVKLLATLLGTSFCGLTFVYPVQTCYSLGIRKMLPSIIDATSLWITSMFWVRMAPFMAHRSIAETIGSIYGTYPRIIVALLSICNAIFKVTFQINVISSIVSTSMDAIHPDIIAVLAALVLIVYATLGGIRAITNTDVLQFITFVAIVFLLAKLMFVKTGKSVLEMVSFLQKQENFKLSSLCQSNGQLLNLLLSIPYCFLALSGPSVIQRVYMCASPIQVRKVFLYGSFFYVLIGLSISLIGLFVFVGNPTLTVKEIWPYIITGMPPFLKVSIVVCVLGMAMSTADSELHLCSILVVHDLRESMRGIKSVSDVHQIRMTKWALLICGLLAMMAAIDYNALFIDDLFKTLSKMAFYTTTFFGCMVPPLFILSVFGFKSSSPTALIGMAAGLLASLVCIQLGYKVGFIPYIVGAVANILGMMAIHYLLPQLAGMGWVGLDPQQKRLQQLADVFWKFKKRIDIELRA